LVESIFRQAGYTVSRLGRESQVHRLIQPGACEFLPDFLVWKQCGIAPPSFDLHHVLAIEAKYRADLRAYLRRFAAEDLEHARKSWPTAYFILVTDNSKGRSCFQVLHVADVDHNPQITTTDLHNTPMLNIYRSTVERHERIATRLFRALRRAPSVLPRTRLGEM
jgi:hypothetical protein